MSIKKCFVPCCENNSENSADKIFIFVPRNQDRRQRWFNAVNKNNPVFFAQRKYHCCEDHFILEEDVENWLQFKLFGIKIRLKHDAVPHRYIQTPPEEKLPSQLTDSAKKFQSENVAAYVEPLRGVKRKQFPIPEASTSRNVDTKSTTSPTAKFSISVIRPVDQSTTFQGKSVQVILRPKFRSIAVGVRVRVKERATSPLFKSSTAGIQSVPTVSSVQSQQSTC